MAGLDVVGDVVGAATALAGLILVYLGSIAASFGSFTVEQRDAVLRPHQWRAWAAFSGFVVALLAAVCAIIAHWTKCEGLANFAVIALFLAFVGGIASAFLTVMEIR
jgi:hypothetical protein